MHKKCGKKYITITIFAFELTHFFFPGELLVIVEYCRFGNLHNYLLRHRGNFIDQIDPKTDAIDISIGADILEMERSMSVSSRQR